MRADVHRCMSARTWTCTPLEIRSACPTLRLDGGDPDHRWSPHPSRPPTDAIGVHTTNLRTVVSKKGSRTAGVLENAAQTLLANLGLTDLRDWQRTRRSCAHTAQNGLKKRLCMAIAYKAA